MTLLVF